MGGLSEQAGEESERREEERKRKRRGRGRGEESEELFNPYPAYVA